MPVFEPSTWAEVEEATATEKVTPEDPFVTQVRHFTDAPERFSTIRSLESSEVANRLPNRADAAPFVSQRSSSLKCPDGQFDDLLGFGRVDCETETLVRKQLHPMMAIALPAENTSIINPSSANFDPQKYLSKIHKDTTEEQLKEGSIVLAGLCKKLDDQAEKLRSEKYVSATLVEAAFESTKKSLLPISPYNQEGTDRETERVFQEAESVLKVRYEDVMRRETKLARLQRALDVYKKYDWVFKLGNRLKTVPIEDVAAIENVMKEYNRGMIWIEAQDAVEMSIIREDLEKGFSVLIDSVVNRLSTAHLTRHVTSRLVSVLVSAKEEDLVIVALNRRMKSARDRLSEPTALYDAKPASLEVENDDKTEHDVCEQVRQASNEFFSGISHVWRLGRVLMQQESWYRAVGQHFKSLCESYSSTLRVALLSDSGLISRNACKEIAGLRSRLTSELEIPESCLSSIDEVVKEITEAFVESISHAVRKSVIHIARQAVEGDTVATESSKILQALLLEAVSQFKINLFKKKEVVTEVPADILVPCETDESTSISDGLDVSPFETLGVACITGLGLFVREVDDNMKESDWDTEISSLKMAICCSDLLRTVVPTVRKHMEESSLFDAGTILKEMQGVTTKIEEIEKRSLSEHCDVLAEPLKIIATRLVTFRNNDVEDAVNRTVPIKIEGVSNCANEIVNQIALSVVTVRRRTSNVRLIRHTLLHVISEVGRTLVEVLSTDKLTYHRGAQLWVDVTFMQEVLTRGASSETGGVQDALDGFSRVKERAVQAVLADGYSFSLVDMHTLKEGVVARGIADASIIYECIAETWRLITPDGRQHR